MVEDLVRPIIMLLWFWYRLDRADREIDIQGISFGGWNQDSGRAHVYGAVHFLEHPCLMSEQAKLVVE